MTAPWLTAPWLTAPWLLAPWLLGPLTGSALLLSFPPLHWHGVAWVALVPLIGSLQAHPAPGRWLGAGWGLGLVFYAGQYAWVAHALVTVAGVSGAAFTAFYLALVGVLAVLPALGLVLCAALRARWGVHAGFSLTVVWAAQDWLLNHAPFGGVAWGSLAAPQTESLAAGLVAPVLGGSGVVLLLGAANGAWAQWLRGWTRAAARRTDRAAWLGTGVALLAGTMLLANTVPLVNIALSPWPGGWLGVESRPSAPEFAALLVPSQRPAASQAVGQGQDAALRDLLQRSMAALQLAAPQAAAPQDKGIAPGARPRLVIWPESAVAGHVADGDTLVSLSRVGTLLDADFLLGSDASDPGREVNALYLVQGGRFDFWRYDKRSRVPFGEYVPAGFGWLFGRKLTAGDRDYSAGTQPPVLDWRGIALGVATCFESILPAHARLTVQHGAQVLVVAANDAWLTPSARAQHVQLSALRALEAGRDALFVSNGGYTGLLRAGRAVPPDGAVLPAGAGAPLWVQAQVRDALTPWVRWGDWPLGGAALLLAAAAWALRSTRRN